MASEAKLLTVQFLQWVAARPRSYAEVRDTWSSTCPLNCAWEDAVSDDLVARSADAHGSPGPSAIAGLLEPTGGVSYRPAARPKRRSPVSVTGHDSLKARRTLDVDGKKYDYFSLEAAAQAAGLGDISRLPSSLKILLENLVRLENGRTVTVDDIKALGQGVAGKTAEREIAFRPARVLMQDLTGVPAVVDLAAMRQAMVDLGGDPNKINPLSPVDLVIDHSVMIDNFGHRNSFKKNVGIEYERNM